MKKEELRKLILTAKGAVEADVVIKNCKVVNVFTGEIQEGDIAISGDQIAGVGQYQGKVEVDAGGRYAAPGFIDSHIHIESSYVSPEELGLIAELTREKNNLNQLAKAQNAAGAAKREAELIRIIRFYNRMIAKLKRE